MTLEAKGHGEPPTAVLTCPGALSFLHGLPPDIYTVRTRIGLPDRRTPLPCSLRRQPFLRTDTLYCLSFCASSMQGLQAHVAVSKHILATDREIEEEILPITMPPASDVRSTHD